MFVCQPRASKIAPSGPMSLTRPISLTRGCAICLSPDSSVNESLNEHCTCLSVDVLCEWYAVRMRRPGKSIRRSFLSALQCGVMRREREGRRDGGPRSADQLVGGMKQCLGRRSSCNCRTVRQSPLRSASNCTSDRQSNVRFVGRSVGRSVGREAWIRQNLIWLVKRTVAVHLLMGLPPHQY